MDILEEIYSKIPLGIHRLEAQHMISVLFNLRYIYDDDENKVETQRLDHSHDTECKLLSFEFDEDDKLIDIDEIH